MGSAPAALERVGGYRKIMSFYKSSKREKRDQTLNLRTTLSMKESLARLDKAWAFLDSLNDPKSPFDADMQPNESATALRLIEESLANAWKEIGGFEPQTDEQWEEFYRIARATHDKLKKNGGGAK